MSKHFHVLLWIPLMYCAFFLFFWIQIYKHEAVSFEDFVLEKQANYAAESAVQTMLEEGDIDTDYADGSFIILEPNLAVRDFANTLSLDFGVVPTDSSIESIMNKNIRTLVVCTYDGTYAYYLQKTETNSWELKQTPKIPYFYTREDGKQYCLTLDRDKGYWDYTEGSSYKLHKFDKYDEKPSDDLQSTAINNQVADIVNWALYKTYNKNETVGDTNHGNDLSIRVPAIADTVRGDQPVMAPTVIAVVEGNVKPMGDVTVAECIGGAAVEEADLVVGFTLKNAPIYTYTDSEGNYYCGDEAIDKAGGKSNCKSVELSGKYYAYSSWWKRHSYLNSMSGVLSNGKYFDDVYDAAKGGYNDLTISD